MFFFFKHKTADEVRISDWSSDVCSSDLLRRRHRIRRHRAATGSVRVAAAGNAGKQKAENGTVHFQHGCPPTAPQPSRTPAHAVSRPPPATKALDEILANHAAQDFPKLVIQIGRAHVLTPVTNAHLVCRPRLEKKNKILTPT